MAKKLLKNVPKKAKQHAKKLEQAMNEVDYFQQHMSPKESDKATKEREDIISGTQMDSIIGNLQSFKPPHKKTDGEQGGSTSDAPAEAAASSK